VHEDTEITLERKCYSKPWHRRSQTSAENLGETQQYDWPNRTV